MRPAHGSATHAELRYALDTGKRVLHSPARTRRIAGLSGFFTLIQSRDGPAR
jgi:hypothetical protein